jgi:hypothetical protein
LEEIGLKTVMKGRNKSKERKWEQGRKREREEFS